MTSLIDAEILYQQHDTQVITVLDQWLKLFRREIPRMNVVMRITPNGPWNMTVLVPRDITRALDAETQAFEMFITGQGYRGEILDRNISDAIRVKWSLDRKQRKTNASTTTLAKLKVGDSVYYKQTPSGWYHGKVKHLPSSGGCMLVGDGIGIDELIGFESGRLSIETPVPAPFRNLKSGDTVFVQRVAGHWSKCKVDDVSLNCVFVTGEFGPRETILYSNLSLEDPTPPPTPESKRDQSPFASLSPGDRIYVNLCHLGKSWVKSTVKLVHGSGVTVECSHEPGTLRIIPFSDQELSFYDPNRFGQLLPGDRKYVWLDPKWQECTVVEVDSNSTYVKVKMCVDCSATADVTLTSDKIARHDPTGSPFAKLRKGDCVLFKADKDAPWKRGLVMEQCLSSLYVSDRHGYGERLTYHSGRLSLDAPLATTTIKVGSTVFVFDGQSWTKQVVHALDATRVYVAPPAATNPLFQSLTSYPRTTQRVLHFEPLQVGDSVFVKQDTGTWRHGTVTHLYPDSVQVLYEERCGDTPGYGDTIAFDSGRLLIQNVEEPTSLPSAEVPAAKESKPQADQPTFAATATEPQESKPTSSISAAEPKSDQPTSAATATEPQEPEPTSSVSTAEPQAAVIESDKMKSEDTKSEDEASGYIHVEPMSPTEKPLTTTSDIPVITNRFSDAIRRVVEKMPVMSDSERRQFAEKLALNANNTVFVRDLADVWWIAVVTAAEKDRVCLLFNGVKTWVNRFSDRIFPMSKTAGHYYHMFSITVGDQLNIKDTFHLWCSGRVVEENVESVKVRYDTYTGKWDEWIRRESDRLEIYNKATLSPGFLQRLLQHQ